MTEQDIVGRIRDGLRMLAELRNQEQELRQELQQARFDLEQSPLGQRVAGLERQLADCGEAMASTRRGVNEQTVAWYEATGDKRPVPGASIRLLRRLRYDVAKATDWCMMNAPTLLRLDTKRFEATAEELGYTDLVVERVPQGTIAGDLSEYREKEA